jgi:hypothetical protein
MPEIFNLSEIDEFPGVLNQGCRCNAERIDAAKKK